MLPSSLLSFRGARKAGEPGISIDFHNIEIPDQPLRGCPE